MQEDIKARERFLITLDWLLALHDRHPQAPHYGLVHVCFHGREALGSAYGANDASQMLVDLARQLRKAFRKTDLVARNLADFWILIPYTSPEAVTDKVAKLVEIASHSGLHIVERDISVFSLPSTQIGAQNRFNSALEFLDHLKQHRQVAMRWEQVAPAFN